MKNQYYKPTDAYLYIAKTFVAVFIQYLGVTVDLSKFLAYQSGLMSNHSQILIAVDDKGITYKSIAEYPWDMLLTEADITLSMSDGSWDPYRIWMDVTNTDPVKTAICNLLPEIFDNTVTTHYIDYDKFTIQYI